MKSVGDGIRKARDSNCTRSHDQEDVESARKKRKREDAESARAQYRRFCQNVSSSYSLREEIDQSELLIKYHWSDRIPNVCDTKLHKFITI